MKALLVLLGIAALGGVLFGFIAQELTSIEQYFRYAFAGMMGFLFTVLVALVGPFKV